RKTLVTRARDFERSIISRISCAFWRRPAARRWIALLFGASAFSPISDAVCVTFHNSKRGATLTQHSTESKFRSFQISYCTILARATVLTRLMQEEKRYELPRFGAFDFAAHCCTMERLLRSKPRSSAMPLKRRGLLTDIGRCLPKFVETLSDF